MNQRPRKPADDDQVLFDRLVDGELSPDEQRVVLSRLDDEPEGWRRCALAFIEAQTWRRELNALADEPCTAPPLHVSAQVGSSPQNTRVWTWLTIAAGLVLAFSLGMLARGGLNTRLPVDQTFAMQPEARQTTGDDANAVQPSDEGPRADAPERYVTLRVPGGMDGRDERFQLPVREGPEAMRDLLSGHAPSTSSEVIEALRRTGHEVRVRRRLVPFQAPDGRSLVVPIDELQVKPANLAVYQ